MFKTDRYLSNLLEVFMKTQQKETGFLRHEGARLYYEIAGSGHPLLLIHAGIADSRMWDEQFDVFAQHYRVIRYDLRGYGKTEQVSPAVRERVRQMQMHAFTLAIPEEAEELPLIPPAMVRLDEVRAPTLLMVGDLDIPERLA